MRNPVSAIIDRKFIKRSWNQPLENFIARWCNCII